MGRAARAARDTWVRHPGQRGIRCRHPGHPGIHGSNSQGSEGSGEEKRKSMLLKQRDYREYYGNRVDTKKVNQDAQREDPTAGADTAGMLYQESLQG
eukprot:655531-Pelagomonas_calceolata.AAC.6